MSEKDSRPGGGGPDRAGADRRGRSRPARGPIRPGPTGATGADRRGLTPGRAGGLQLAAASSYSSVRPRVMLGSIWIPGPIVVVTVIFRRYLPLAADGLSRTISSIAAA